MDYEKKYNDALNLAKSYYGKGSNEFLDTIFPELAESEDERIRKWLYNMVENLGYPADEAAEKELEEMQPLALAYLEKQKEPENASASTMIPSCCEVEQKEQKPLITGNDFGWIDELTHDLKHPEELDEKVQEVLKKRQKPVEYLDKDKVYAIMTKLTNLSYSQLIPINSDEFRKLHEITSDVRSLLDYPIEQKPAEWSEEDKTNGWTGVDLGRYLSCLQRLGTGNPQQPETINSKWFKEHCHPQPKQEWDTHDKAIVNCIVCCLDGQFVSEAARKQALVWFNKHRRDFLNSTSWKPSEEQMEALHELLGNVPRAPELYELFNDLEKLGVKEEPEYYQHFDEDEQ